MFINKAKTQNAKAMVKGTGNDIPKDEKPKPAVIQQMAAYLRLEPYDRKCDKKLLDIAD